MNLGKRIRLQRIFGHPSGRLCSIAVDHFIGYGEGLPRGLRQIGATLEAVMAAAPDAVTMHKGIAAALWAPYAGRTPWILQSTLGRPDDLACCQQASTPEDAVRLGADGFAVAAFVRHASESIYLKNLADCVREAARFEMPVFCHIYPRDVDKRISFAPDDIAWAVRCALEMGADVIKTPYCGDLAAHRQIVAECPVPVVAAGGPQAGTFLEALRMMGEVVEAGAVGATIGRNVWSFPHVTAAVRAFKAVIHDRQPAAEAARPAGVGETFA